MTLTRKGAETRDRIVEGAAAAIRELGVTVRLEDIMARTRTSKGQLFHYFPDGKEELLLAVARHEADRVIADQQPMLGDLGSWPAWQAWRDRVVDRYRSQGRNCPLSALIGPTGNRSPAAQAVVTELMRRWRHEIATGIRRMQATSAIGAGVDADRAASALVAGIQGGVLMLLTTGEIGHLEAVLDLSIAALKNSLGVEISE
jgi:AcrR family transcriptional regulator